MIMREGGEVVSCRGARGYGMYATLSLSRSFVAGPAKRSDLTAQNGDTYFIFVDRERWRKKAGVEYTLMMLMMSVICGGTERV